jgi:arylsulfatase A-like enzyme
MTDSLDFFEGEVPVERIGYMTDLLTQRAIEYLRRPHQKPFYLSLHYTSPHWPWEGPNDAAFSKAMKYNSAGFRAGGSIKVYAEMMRSLDDGIGQVLAALKSAKLDGDTLVIFTSDNGGERFSYNWPFRGAKLDVFEGGVRVPAIVRWPGVQSKPRVSDQPVITMDWSATMIAAAGAKPAAAYPLDGDDLNLVINGRRPKYDRSFFWRVRAQGGMRSGQWKYVRIGNNEFLFDLSVDEREQADYSEREPQKLAELRALFKAWESEMLSYPPRPTISS